MGEKRGRDDDKPCIFTHPIASSRMGKRGYRMVIIFSIAELRYYII
jgi:hypothetical protein